MQVFDYHWAISNSCFSLQGICFQGTQGRVIWHEICQGHHKDEETFTSLHPLHLYSTKEIYQTEGCKLLGNGNLC